MKVLLTAWLLYGGQLVPESISQREFSSFEECYAMGKKLGAYFDGKKTLMVSQYVCTEKGVDA